MKNRAILQKRPDREPFSISTADPGVRLFCKGTQSSFVERSSMSGSPQDIKVLLRRLEALDQVSLAKESNTSRALLRERHPLRQLRISEVLLRC